MKEFVIINNVSEINLSNQWIDPIDFSDKRQLVDDTGKYVDSAYSGRKYELISLRYRLYTCPERTARGLLATVIIICSLGFALLLQCVRELVTKHKDTILFAKPLVLPPPEAPTDSTTEKPKEESIPAVPTPPPQTTTSSDITVFQHSPLPLPQEGVIKNGYGEYLVYRLTPTSQRVAITEQEYAEIYSIIEECRALGGDQIPEDRYNYLKTKIQNKLSTDVHLAFIPRTLYELIYLKECVQEDVNNERCSHAIETSVHSGIEDDDEEWVNQRFPLGFWQQCLFKDKDYATQFAPRNKCDYRQKHLQLVAARLNQVALSHFEKMQTSADGFTYVNFCEVQHKLVAFFKEVHDPNSELHQKVNDIDGISYHGIAKECADEVIRVRGKADKNPIGIATERHEQIIQRAMQLECSAQAINSIVLYRGSTFSLDYLTRKSNENPQAPKLANSLSYGTSLYGGAIYDTGATAFHYMRKPEADAQALVVPLQKQSAGETPFYICNVHPLISLMSRGEHFHARGCVEK